MSQRASLSVPAPSPDTSMNLGTAWSSQSWTSDGFCVNTDGRIWLQADGSGSTMGVLSNGGAGVGQLLLQSLQENVYLMAKGTTVAAANESLFIGGTDSVRIAGALGIDINTLVGQILNDDSLSMIEPSATDPSSDAAAHYTQSVQTFASHTATFTAATTTLALVADGFRKLFGAVGGGGKSTLSAGLAAAAIAAKSVAAAVSSASIWSDGVKGLYVQSVGSTNIGTPTWCSIYSGLATLSQAPATALYGVDLHILAGIDAGLRSFTYTKLDGSNIEVTGGLSCELGSRAGKFKVYAKDIVVGAKGGEAATQLPTTTCTMEATQKIDCIVAPGNFEMLSGGTVKMTGASVSCEGSMDITIESPAYTVTINPLTGVSIEVLDTSKVTIDVMGFDAAVGSQAVTIDASGITLGSPSSFISVDATGTWSWRGPMVAFV